ncbi:uncharacterized protein LOC130670021 isoform X1 [Microplitis mediator]|uniref:uncharacterized protein LOC130670021 isoform X1 n=1 Tax=Microplitis mediator TaxID=375433 RepID=UPI0025550659|nr:uncharacterized protein LOC130670021 isoform X1 [Microplitis mediator]
MYCRECDAYLGEGRSPMKDCFCSACGPKQEIKNLSYFISLNLHSQITNLLTTKNIDESLKYRFTRIKKVQGAIEDIYDGAEYKKLSSAGMFLSNPYNFSLTFNTDGCKISNSSKSSAWPIYVQINELSPHLRKKHVLLAGIFVDKKEPLMNDYLRTFTDQIKVLYEEGIVWKPTPTMEVTSKFVTILGSVDTPARSAVLRMKRFNGFYGCTFCYAFGKSIGRKHVYPVGNSSEQLRTDDEMRADMMKSFADKNEIKGIKGPSALMLLPLFNLSKGMIVDSMHCCFLSVIKWHTKLLLKKDYKDVIINIKKKKVVVDYYIGRPGQKEEIDSLFLAIKPHNIRSRLPRSINTLATW